VKLITDNHYHIWTDALHARQLSIQTTNRWNRGTYIRWTILTAWTALEIACQEALSFRRKLDDVILQKGYSKIDWGSGLWQRVSQIQELRKNIAHRFVSENDLFPNTQVAEETIIIIRKAITDIFLRCNKPAPSWTNDDFDDGWTTGVMSVHTTGYNSTYENRQDSIKITYVYKEKEITWAILEPGTDPQPNVEKLIENIRKPISTIRVYKNGEKIDELHYSTDKIRGT